MAKWGEGDPRWIVEERPDATNVNNWHWTEKNASFWSIERIKELFKNVPIENDFAEIELVEVEKCEGEASANNRKGKLFFFYEWDLTIKWNGKIKDGKIYDGLVKIPNLSEENHVSEIDIQVSIKDSDDIGDKLKEVLIKNCKIVIRDLLLKYISSLKDEFSKGMILPKKEDVKPESVKNLSSGFNKKINMTPVVSNTKQGCIIDVDTINIKQDFQCKAQEFYDALTKIEMVTAFTRSHCKIDLTKNGTFEMFNGNITGVFLELIPAKKVKQQWRYKQWPTGHYSIVTITINEKSDYTEVNIEQTGVPIDQVEVTRENWQRYYWDSIKRAFGFGAFIA